MPDGTKLLTGASRESIAPAQRENIQRMHALATKEEGKEGGEKNACALLCVCCCWLAVLAATASLCPCDCAPRRSCSGLTWLGLWQGREGRGTTKRSEQQQRQNILTRLQLIVRAHAHADHTTSPPTPGLWQGGAEYMTAACGGEIRGRRGDCCSCWLPTAGGTRI